MADAKAETPPALFSTYFDASGAPDSDGALVVVGCVARVQQWSLFEHEWSCLLAEHKINPPFHMRQFAPGAGQFADWKDDKLRRAEFLSSVIEIIKRRVDRTFSTTLVLRHYRRLNASYRLKEAIGNPFPFCAGMTIRLWAEWMVRDHPEDLFNQPVFEDGDKHKGEFIMQMTKVNSVPSFKKKHEAPPLQVPDFIAWEHGKAVRDKLQGKLKTMDDFRHTFAALEESVPMDSRLIDFNGLHELCEKERIRRR